MKYSEMLNMFLLLVILIVNLNQTFFFSVPLAAAVKAEEDELDIDGTVEEDIGKSRDGSRTDDEAVQRYFEYLFHIMSVD